MIEDSYSQTFSADSWIKTNKKKDLHFWAHLRATDLGINGLENEPPEYELPKESTIKNEFCDQMKIKEGEIEMKYDIKSENITLPTDCKYYLCQELKLKLEIKTYAIEENYSNTNNIYCHSKVDDDKFGIPTFYSNTYSKLSNDDKNLQLKVEHSKITDCINIKHQILKVGSKQIVEKREDHKSQSFPIKDYEVSTKIPTVPCHKIEDTVFFLNNLGLRPVWQNSTLFKSPVRANRLGKFRRNRNNKI